MRSLEIPWPVTGAPTTRRALGFLCATFIGLAAPSLPAAAAAGAMVLKCGKSTWTFADAGGLVVHSPPTNPSSGVPLERIGFRTSGSYQLKSSELTVRLERNQAVSGSRSDLALLGDMADSRMTRISRYQVRQQGSDWVFTEVFRSVNGSERSQRSTMTCQAAR